MWATKSSYMAFLWTKINTKTSFLHTHKQTKQKTTSTITNKIIQSYRKVNSSMEIIKYTKLSVFSPK